jgi:two-component system, NtrC family, sensor kinase
VAFVQGEAQREGRMLELNVEQGLPKVPYDPARLRQALLNLLRNAAEAAGHGGTVRLSAKRGGKLGGVRIAVEDTGPGVPDDVKARLFEPFFTTKPSGTGLGLLLTAEIVKEHRGELSLETSPLGGAAFFLDLPPG